MSEKDDKLVKIKQQEKLYKNIKSLTEFYNLTQREINPEETQQLIVCKHAYGCNCVTCWYEYNGDKYSHIKTNSIYTDIFNSDQRFYKD